MTSLYDTNQIGVWAVPGQIPPFLLVLSSLWKSQTQLERGKRKPVVKI